MCELPKVACRNSKRYKGVSPPKCGCLVCTVIWLTKEVRETKALVERLEADRRSRFAGYPGYD